MGRQIGLTLFELLITLFIVALLLNTALPDFSAVVEAKRLELTAKQIQQGIEIARNAAITKNTMVTLCRSNQGETCIGSWSKGMLIFVDHNADRKVDEEDVVIRHITFPQFEGEITWRAFQNRQTLQITALGFTNYQNGNFTLCPANGEIHLARQLIITRTARVRHAKDRNGDGIREDSRGRPLKCD